jgi:hypothetical protein
MVFLVREQKGEWHWRLHSTKLKAIIAASSQPCPSEEQCVAQIRLIRDGAPEAVIRYEHERGDR